MLLIWGAPREELKLVKGDFVATGGELAKGDFVLVRLKNRFAKPLFNGYQDSLYSIALYHKRGCW